MIGGSDPASEPSWEILTDLKEIVEIVVSDKFTDKNLRYLGFKLSDHRLLLTATFPNQNFILLIITDTSFIVLVELAIPISAWFLQRRCL